MRYLYFQPKSPIVPTSKRWSILQQKILFCIKNCSRKKELMQTHSQMIRSGFIEDDFLVSRIIAFLSGSSNSDDMVYARKMFDQISQPNLFMWNCIIRGYTHFSASTDALIMYRLMILRGLSPDSYTYSVLTRACSQINWLWLGEAVHGSVIKRAFEMDMFVMSGFLNIYSSCGEIAIARKIFDSLQEKDVVSWTLMVTGYAKVNCWDEAIALLQQMEAAGGQPNNVTITSLLSICCQFQNLDRGKWIHSHILGSELEHDLAVANSLISMYAKCGSMPDAVKVFQKMLVRDRITWNALIGGLVINGLHAEALKMFKEMACSDAVPDEVTIVSALSACARLSDLQQGKLLHDYINAHKFDFDLILNNALINMYAKCGDLQVAEAVFHDMPKRDVFSWTAIISGYAQAFHLEEALNLFNEMLFSNVEANDVTLASLLSACAELGALDHGKRIHSYMEESGVEKDVPLWNSLVNMYAKCGCIEIASKLFHELPQKDISSWNAMIGGLAAHGCSREAVNLFNLMEKFGEAKPDCVTFMAVLSACAHMGLVYEGYYYFNSMAKYGVVPTVGHYGCMIDLLGRAGLIVDAIDFIKNMCARPNSVILGSLISACRIHQKLEVAKDVIECIIDMGLDDEGALVLVSNLYAEGGRWDDVRRLRCLMESKGIEKSPGCSFIDVDGVILKFVAGDSSIQRNSHALSVLNDLGLHLKQPRQAIECAATL